MHNVKDIKFLALLSTSNKKRRQALLETASKKELQKLTEIVYNLLQDNIPLTKAEKKKLSRYKETLREVAHKRCKLQKRREIFTQKGGFLRFLLPLALQAIISGTGAVLKKRAGL